VRKPVILLSMGFLCTSFTGIPSLQTFQRKAAAEKATQSTIPFSRFDYPVASTELYHHMNLQQYGLSAEAFDFAWKGYQDLLDKKMIDRSDYLTICDFSQSSKNKRFYVIDVANQKLIIHTYAAHGKNSGGEFATRFSNEPESLKSSLGFYITGNTYSGAHGLSLRIRGVDPGFNDKALERNIVIHGAGYVDEARAKAGIYMGRSWGCPVVPQKESAHIITTIKNGTCFFIFHPSRNYLLGSKIFNG
jgi:hypothetical protein